MHTCAVPRARRLERVTERAVTLLLIMLTLMNYVGCSDSAAAPVDPWRSLHRDLTAGHFQALLRNHTKYNSRFPFPFTVVDNFLPWSVAHEVEREIPDRPDLLMNCVRNASVCKKTRTHHYSSLFEHELALGPATSAVLAFLKSSTFVRFLEQLSGIPGLLPDPHNLGAGVHQTLTRGFMHVHADAHYTEKTNLHRRVAVVLYLNPAWPDDWGGHLELWGRDLRTCYAKIRPDLNRLVIFSTSDWAYHGFQQPLLCPEQRSRRALVAYYYSASRPVSECAKGDCLVSRATAFQKTLCPRCSDQRCQPPAWAAY